MSQLSRALDIAVSAAVLLLLAPVMAVLAILVRLNMKMTPIFRQARLGHKEREFAIRKFRTMTEERGPDGRLLPDERRLTPLGRFLRGTSLDELPQFWNVLKGDMSLVGPRPLLVSYLPRYNARQHRRHDVKPGITGWAQVVGRNRLGWEERFELDVWYVENKSLLLDLEILWMTILKVLHREDISQPGEATMSEFMGSGAAVDRSSS